MLLPRVREWQNAVALVARPYAYIKYDRIIQKKRKEYLDPKSSRNLKKLKNELGDIQNIMKKNIDDIIQRHGKLDGVARQADRMREDSKKFKWGAKKLNLMEALQRYGPVIACGGIVVLVLAVKFF